MKHHSADKRKKMAKPLDKVFPKINKLLKSHGLQEYSVSEIVLSNANDGLKCKPGYHVETYCDEMGRCYPICVKDIV